MVERLLRCAQCNQVIPRFGSLGDFGERSTLFGVEWSSDDLDSQKEFLLRHEGHPLEELTVDPETFVSDRPSWEPVKTSYVEASNGRQRFVIKRMRTSLARPVSYELIPGEIRVSPETLEIQEEEVRKEISWLNGSFPVPGDKVNKFMEAFREEIRSIPAESIPAAIDKVLPGDTPLLAFGSLSENRWEKVLLRCESHLRPSELQGIQKFIRENCAPDEALALQIRNKISISGRQV